MNPLIAIPQPRDIPEFLTQTYEEFRGSKYDRLVIQYHDKIEAYRIARKLFLENKQYTHYIYATDDIIWSDESLDKLISDYEKYFGNDNTVVLAPDMNTDMQALEENSGTRAFMTDKYPVQLIEHNRTFIQEDYHFAKQDDDEVKNAPNGIVKCSWISLGLAIIPRHVMEHTTFSRHVEYNNMKNPDKEQGNIYDGCCLDIIFAQECKDNGFSLYTDMNVEILHLKQSNEKDLWLREYYKVGLKPKSVFFLNAHTNEKRTVL